MRPGRVDLAVLQVGELLGRTEEEVRQMSVRELARWIVYMELKVKAQKQGSK